jgi:hypothetical protein
MNCQQPAPRNEHENGGSTARSHERVSSSIREREHVQFPCTNHPELVSFSSKIRALWFMQNLQDELNAPMATHLYNALALPLSLLFHFQLLTLRGCCCAVGQRGPQVPYRLPDCQDDRTA